MGGRDNGKLLLLHLLLVFSYVPGFWMFANCDHVRAPDEHEQVNHVAVDAEGVDLRHEQQLLLRRLEELVRNLSEVVSRLETRASTPSGDASDEDSVERGGYSDTKVNGEVKKKDGEVEERDGFGSNARDGERARKVSVTKYSPFWSEKFQFSSAVKLDLEATCINVLPYRDYEGLSKYVAVGDERGRVYVFLRNGDVLVEFDTMLESPVTAMVSYMSVYKNESVMVTGHHSGVVSVHKVWEGSNGDEWSSFFMKTVGKSASLGNSEDEGSTITILEVHHVGRMRYIMSIDISGRINVLKEDGTAYGSVMPSSRPLAFLKQRLLFLTETGAGSLDLRSMKLRESECEGLNRSLARSYVFDATERSKAYGYTSEGDLIHVSLLGDVMNFKCRVRYKKKFEMEEPVTLETIKGYLLVVNREKVFVYNVSSHHYARVGVPRLLFSAYLDEIRSSFLNHPIKDVEDARETRPPLVACDREKLVVLGLGSGFVGMYRSDLPIFKGEFNTMMWTSPVLFFILFLFGAWHFFAKKKEALMGPDDPFSSTSATIGTPLGATSGDRSFVESSSRSDLMDLRGGGLRPSRRYGSPSRYPSGTTGSFRPSLADHNSRPPVDPNYRTSSSELKFRGSSMESSGFAKRRESLFVNSQAGDDNN
ncbi:uncharacterized membrane protein At1g75140 [Rhodamnia argentea]|uniref:Uncharacterized membrane protein At1g75140 n=1 Tax=Rhodamnia argentea TaxID=178133 RepID=A0ABM3H308_9MYRT|nr:uncharacterized membrane protein At1g75140 [Rhodamnia argentea]